MAAISVPVTVGETFLLEKVASLIKRGADVDARDQFGYTALVKRAGEGKMELSKLLINNKADVNAQRDGGSTALMRAARNGHGDVAKLLIDNKADPKITNAQGETAADQAKKNKKHETFVLCGGKPDEIASWD